MRDRDEQFLITGIMLYAIIFLLQGLVGFLDRSSGTVYWSSPRRLEFLFPGYRAGWWVAGPIHK